ncbi:glycosyltransferase family 2 protein [uncultured Mucilaginibacter sp.]|uniref:glycosyltransferase family 2 protein n=1 Tax=uncultured Mucilaginibacter sp. TaxID=797541 RepID=UPI00261F3E31|nr:glycosyltransferase family 2 protein [uncultured Mucilaginibacter sp.]
MHISIIIPAFNAAKTIAATLKSALAQQSGLFKIEIIVVNDGSTDGTATILNKYKDACRIITQVNAGASAARQKGFENSAGQYIQYLDSDDLLLPGKIQQQAEAMMAQDADIAYGDFEKFTAEDGRLTVKEIVKGDIQGNPEIEIFKSFWRPPCAMLYSRKIAEKICWSETLPVIQDARYFLDAVFMGGKLVYTPGLQAKYRIHQSQSLSQRSNLAFVKDCFVNATEVYLIWKKNLESNPEKKNALIEVLRYCIHEFSILNQNLFIQAIDLLLEIEPNYIPEKSLSLKVTSRFFGYRNAERLAALKRKL